MAVDVNPSQDDGCHKEDCQYNAHDGAQVHGGGLYLGGQVVLEACRETVRAGGAAGEQERWGRGVLGSDKDPEMKANRTFGSTLNKYMKDGAGGVGS